MYIFCPQFNYGYFNSSHVEQTIICDSLFSANVLLTKWQAKEEGGWPDACPWVAVATGEN